MKKKNIVISCTLSVSALISACSTPQTQQMVTHSHHEVPEMPGQMVELTRAQRFEGILDAHNKVRAKHGLPPLIWSDQLADYSREWANKLCENGRCKMQHRKGDTPFGENLYWSSPWLWSSGEKEVQNVTIHDVVKVWADEEQWFDYDNNRCQPGQQCGHYTQIVWNDTKEVGCAMKVGADKSQTWVCNYNPPGNFYDMKPY